MARNLVDEIKKTQSSSGPRNLVAEMNKLQPAAPSVTDDMSTGEKLMAGVGSGLLQAKVGAQQADLDLNTHVSAISNALSDRDGIAWLLSKWVDLTKGSPEEIVQSRAKVDAEAKQIAEESAPLLETTAGKVGNFLGQAAPAVAVPGGGSGPLAARIATGAAAGGLIGATQYVDEGESRLENAATGAAFGGGIPVAMAGVKKAVVEPVSKAIGAGIDQIKPLFGRSSKSLVQELAGDSIERGTQKALDASRRLGDDFLTPAEASGRSRLAAIQGKLGVSEKGANLIEDAFKTRGDTQGKIIHKFLADLSPDGSSAAGSVRQAAQGVFKDMEGLRARAAKPFYKEAFSKAVPDAKVTELMQDPVIARAFDKVGSDPIWQKQLKGKASNSVEYLHTVKESIDDVIGQLQSKGERKAASAVLDSKRMLTSALEEVAPEYKTANQVYAAFSRNIDSLKDSTVGKIADLDNTQLKRVSKIVFDPSETDSAARNKVRMLLQKKDPEAWNKLIRNEIERRLGSVKGDVNGSVFYREILSKPKDFKVFIEATRDNPMARRKLLDMKRAWKDLVNQKTVKTAEGQAKSSLDVPRSTFEAGKNWVIQNFGSKYDEAAARFITSNKWDKEYQAVSRIKEPGKKMEALGALLSKIAAEESTD